MTEGAGKLNTIRKRRVLNSLGGQMVLLMSGILLVAMITNAYIQFRDEVSTMEQVLKVRAQSLGQMLSSVSVDSLVELAHNLGLKVVAEGVETGSTLTQLELLGCDSVQGFFYSPAVDAAILPSAVEEIERDFEES